MWWSDNIEGGLYERDLIFIAKHKIVDKDLQQVALIFKNKSNIG